MERNDVIEEIHDVERLTWLSNDVLTFKRNDR